tara:strand:+ start:279 stop:1040 length:762 start_codon:yes stop_codon:yes gene_type:complete
MKIIALAVTTVTIVSVFVKYNEESLEEVSKIKPVIEERADPFSDKVPRLDIYPDKISIPPSEDTPILVLPPVIVYPKETDPLLAFNFSRVVPILPKIPNHLPEINWHRYMLDGVMYYEGYYNRKYLCAGGQATIGYGCTNPKIVSKGHVSRSYAKAVLHNELKHVRDQVLQVVSVDLNRHQLCALTSFTFNCGLSNLRRLVNQPGRLNDGNYKSVEVLLPKYRKAGGVVRKGLEKRRMWELQLWKGKQTAGLF